MPQQQNLRKRPSEAGEETRSHDEDEADQMESRLARDHHDNAAGHCQDDETELPTWCLEPEEESEHQHKSQRAGLAHGEEGEGYVAERGVAEADVEGGRGSAREESGRPKEGRYDGFHFSGRASVVSPRGCALWTEAREE